MATIIYAVRNDRLGGRLGAMLNAARIAGDYGADFRFLWPDHEEVSPELRQPWAIFTRNFLTDRREVARSSGSLLAEVQAVESLPPSLTRPEF